MWVWGPSRASGGHFGRLAAEVCCSLVSLQAFPRCWSQRDRAEPGRGWFLSSDLHVCLAEEGWDVGLAYLFIQVPPARLAGEAAGALSLLFRLLWLCPQDGLPGWARKTAGC